ncbi:MAG: hypothetical protein ACQEQF_13005 [Bacillota bacterium]
MILINDNFEKLKAIKKWKNSIEGIVKTEFSFDFIEKMKNRMIVSYFKYGRVRNSYKNGKINALESADERIKKYKETGNLEYLIDASNFIMCEYMYPQNEDAYFEGTDSNGSIGRIDN